MFFFWRIFLCVVVIALLSAGGWQMYLASIPIAFLIGSLENCVIRNLVEVDKNNRFRYEEHNKKIKESRNKNV